MATAFEDWSKYAYVRGKSATQVFIVTAATDGNNAIDATGVAVNQPYSLDATLLATPAPATSKVGPTTYNVTWSYEPAPEGQHRDPTQTLLQPSRVRYEPGTYSEEVDADRYGNVIANLAGSIYEPRARKDYNSLFVTVTRYYSTYQVGLALQYMNKVNQSPFTMAGLGTVGAEYCKCLLIAPTQEITFDSTEPVEVAHRFEVRGPLVTGLAEDPGFRHRVVNRGRRAWYTDSAGTPRTGRITAKGINGWEPVDEDVLLAGGGIPVYNTFKVEDGKEPIANPAGAPENVGVTSGVVHLLFDIEDTVDFAPLIAGL